MLPRTHIPTTWRPATIAACLVGALLAVAACADKDAPTRPTEPVTPLAITTQPASQTIASGASASLSVTGEGTAPLGYQWYTGASGETGAPIANATAAGYSTPSLTASATYWVRVSDTTGAVNSTTATITVTTSTTPVTPPAGTPDPPVSPTPTPTPTPDPTPTPAPTPAPTPSGPSSIVIVNEPMGRLFPGSNWWNQDISNAPVDANSSSFISYIGTSRSLHPDFGPPPYGMPYVTVGGTQTRLPVTFVQYGNESDSGIGGVTGYPVPDDARTQPNYIEGGAPGGGSSGDRHLLIVDRDRSLLFELYATRWNSGANRWEAGSGAIFDFNRNDRRPEGWTSADAAGLAILPGLVRYDEASGGGAIGHAFRVTLRNTNGYVWPASHNAGSTGGALPMGARLRLKASKDISGFPPQAQRIFQAMKAYGLVVADNGTDMYITGTMDSRWNNDVLNPAFGALKASDFEVIQLGWR